MRIPDLDKILSAMLQTYEGISDLNFSVGHPMQVEDFGELKPVFVDPPIEALTVKRIGGTGPVVDDLEWDVKVYFALNAALHDAACAAWSIKRYYDGWRPIGASTVPRSGSGCPWTSAW